MIRYIGFIMCYAIALLIAIFMAKFNNYELSAINMLLAPIIGIIFGGFAILLFDFYSAPIPETFTIQAINLVKILMAIGIPVFDLILPFIRLNYEYKNFNDYDKILTYLSFSQLKNMYLINPEKWETGYYRCIYYDKYNDKKYFGFKSIIDFYKYLRFLKWIAKNRLTQEQYARQKQKDKELTKVLTEWTAAIEEYRNENVYIPLEKIKHNVKMKES